MRSCFSLGITIPFTFFLMERSDPVFNIVASVLTNILMAWAGGYSCTSSKMITNFRSCNETLNSD